jgi:alpha-glucosidase (family GH31 glycosyl hydrolase)
MVLDAPWVNCDFDYQWSSGYGGNATSTKKCDSLKAIGTKIMVINDPMIESTCSPYADGVSKGMFAKCGTGQCVAGWYGGYLLDPTAPGFSSWLWSKMGSLYTQGISAWWLDLPEPEGEPTNTVYSAGPAAQIHNFFSNFFSAAYYRAQDSAFPNTRPFILTRCGNAGIQQYGIAVWTGDIGCNYNVFTGHPPEAQNCGLSGIPWWTNDCGGFITGCYKNDCSAGGAQALLYQRWMQFTCFAPITRAHSNNNCSPTQFGAGVQATCLHYISLRYRLLPYIYSYAWQCHTTGAPLLRALVFDYQNDTATYTLKTEFLFGDQFLVAPVTTEATTTKSVYFPKGTWINYDSGTTYTGSLTATVSAPLTQIPLFVKSGAIIPMAPLMMYTTQKKWDPITLTIYPDPDSASQFTMYQDDDSTQNYATSNAYTLTNITSSMVPSVQEVVTLTQSNQLFVPSTYEYSIHFPAQKTTPSPVTFNGLAVNALSSQTAYSAAATGMWWDSTNKVLWAKGATSTATTYVLAVSLNGLPVSVKGVRPTGVLPGSFDLKVLPDRTGSGAQIRFAVPDAGSSLSIDLYDLAGRQVATLAKGVYSAGYHTAVLNSAGSASIRSAGWYLCRMKAQGFDKTVKVMVKR